jgi:hypothetical protein
METTMSAAPRAARPDPSSTARRPRHALVTSLGETPHSRALYGSMKCLLMPAPKCCWQNSSKLCGVGFLAAKCACKKPERHS